MFIKCLGVFVLVAFAALLTWQWRGWNFDDAYIVFRIVSNLVSGDGWAFNPGEAHNASTSVLNTILIALVSLSGVSITASGHLLGGASICFASILVYRYLLNSYRYPFVALIGGGFVAWKMATNATWGLETNLFIALVLAACTLEKSRIRWVLVGIAVLARPDALLLALFLLLSDVKRFRRPRVSDMLWAGLIILPWAVYSLVQFHQLFPDTLSNKMWQGRSGYWGEGLIYMKGLFTRYSIEESRYGLICLAVATAGAVLSGKRARLPGVFLLFVIFQQVAYMVLNVPPQHWYMALSEVAVIFMMFIFIAEAAERIRAAQPEFGRFVYMKYGALTLGVLVWGVTKLDVAYTNTRDLEYRSIIHAIDDAYGEGDLAVVEVGGIGYYSDRKIVDIVGLTSPEGQFVTADRMDHFYAIAPQYILLHDPFWGFEVSITGDQRFEEMYRRVERFPMPQMSMQLFEKKPEAIARSRPRGLGLSFNHQPLSILYSRGLNRNSSRLCRF